MQLDSNIEKAAVALVLAWLMVTFFFPPVGAIIAGVGFGLAALLGVINWGIKRLQARSTSY
jgi:hypothetical protein